MSTAIENLSVADQHTLLQVFDPESAPTAPSITLDPTLPPDPQISDPVLLKELKQRELEAVKLVESHTETPLLSFAVNGTADTIMTNNDSKQRTYLASLKLLDSLISEHPNYASAYNNRAQLKRWRYGDDLINISSLRSSSELISTLDNVLQDLNKAIFLASPPPRNGRVSTAQTKLLGQAWMQKGAIFWGMSQQNVPTEQDQLESASSQGYAILKWDKSQFEEEGSKCFFMAGLYGNEAGKGLAVRMNPYARLCGSIVKEAMKREGVA